MAFTFLQLANRVRQNCGVSGSDYATLQGLTGEGLRIANWVNESWFDIQSMRQDWQWMRKSTAFPLVTAQPFYAPAALGLTDWGMWARNTFRNYANPQVVFVLGTPGVVTLQGHGLSVGDTITPFTTGSLPSGLTANTTVYVQSIVDANNFTVSATNGGVAIAFTGTQSGTQTITSSNTITFAGFRSEVFMEYDEYDDWRDAYEFGSLRLTQTRPLNITINPLKAIGVGPFPQSGYTIVGDYYSVPTYLVNDTDTPSLPDKFQLAIVYGAMIAYGQYESAPDVLGRAQPEFDKWMRRINADQVIEIGSAGPLC